MNRHAIIALMLCLAAVPLCLAGTPTSDFEISMNGRYLSVSEGEVYFGRTRYSTWSIMGTQIKSDAKGGG